MRSIQNLPTTITSDTLGGATNQLNLPQTDIPSSLNAGAAIGAAASAQNGTLQGMIAEEQAKIAEAQKAKESSAGGVQSLIQKLGFKGQAQVQAEEAGGIPTLTKANTDLVNEYNTKSEEYKTRIEAIGKSGIPLNSAQYASQVRSLEKERDSQLADIAIRQSVALNNLNSVQQQIDRKIDLEYGDLKDLIGYQMNFLDMNREDLTKAEENQFNLMLTDNQRKYDEGVKIGEFAKTVAANGADANTISKVSGAKTMEEAINAAGSFAGDVLDRQIKQAQLAKLGVELSQAKLDAIAAAAGATSPYQAERQFRTTQSVDELGIKARQSPGIFGRTAALPLPDFARTDAYRNFKTELDTLKANIAFGELTAMREASKTGGALGSIAVQELELLESTLGGLNMTQSAENFNAQLSKVKNSIIRWQNAVNQSGGQTQLPTVTSPTGEEIIIID
jgi:hypothetical protein